MKKNLGSMDRILRILLGLSVLVGGYFFGSYLAFIGLIPLITGLFGWCPVYLPFGLNTTRMKAEPSN